MNRLLVVLLVMLASYGVSAQATFPLTVKAYWDAPLPADGVISYLLTVNTAPAIPVPNLVINDVNCPLATKPSGCVMTPVTISAAGQYTFSVVAVGQFMNSDPAVSTVNIGKPGQVVWFKVTK